jgi:hypothetical protein
MRNLILFAILALGLAFSGCQKTEVDQCERVVCFNGGVCVDGTCDCPPGTTGLDCSGRNPCYNITCLNGGTCINGNCDCPTGYTGSDCGTAMTPTSVSITSMNVTKYPATQPSGAGWDVSDGADVFVTFSAGISANTTEFKSGFTYTNVTGQDLPFSTGFPVNLLNINNNYTLGIWDYDAASADDFMAGVYFSPSNNVAGFPSTITLSTTKLTAVLTVQWNF